MIISCELAKFSDYTELLGQSDQKLMAQSCRRILRALNYRMIKGQIKFNAGKHEVMHMGKNSNYCKYTTTSKLALKKEIFENIVLLGVKPSVILLEITTVVLLHWVRV